MKFNFLWAAKGSIKSLHFWNPLRQPRPKLPPGADLPQEPQKFLMPVFLGFTRFLYSQISPPGLNSVWVYYLLYRVRLFATLWTVAHKAPLSMEFSRQEYWGGLPFPSPGALPNPWIKTVSHVAGRFFTV